MIFQNVDGNRTNFDGFNLELDEITEKLVGLVETNVEIEESAVYNIEGYNCFYQDKLAGKSKGTGIALYVKNNLNGVVRNKQSWVTKNLETLFLTIQHEQPVHIGLMYCPSSGNSTDAHNECNKIMELLWRTCTY